MTRHHWLTGSEAQGLHTVIHPSVRSPRTSGVATVAGHVEPVAQLVYPLPFQ